MTMKKSLIIFGTGNIAQLAHYYFCHDSEYEPVAFSVVSGYLDSLVFCGLPNTIQPFVNIGNNVTLWSGNHIGHHSIIRDHCFLASHVVVSGGVEIGEQCFIGVNATLRDHIKVGDRCVIGAGTLILGDALSDGVYFASASERSKVPSTRLRGI